MKIIGANFKMNFQKDDINNYLEVIKNKFPIDNIIFFPSDIYIEDFSKNNYLVGSQNISFQEFGAVTGDTSILQLKELGIKYTLIGHSERRKYFNDDNYIADKIKLALKNDIIPVLCIGESLREYENNLTKDKLKEQIDIALKDNRSDKIIIAYEPIWSIGTGKIPTNDILTEIISFIKNYINENYQTNLKVIYGGSVNLDNILELNKINNLDGYLIGGATLNPNKFLELIDKIK